MTIRDCLAVSGVVFESPLMREVLGHMEKAAASRTGVMVCGEPGTGRGLVARTLHACAGTHSAAPQGAAVDGAAAEGDGAPFVTVDCGALPPSEAERLIFGVAGNGHGNGSPRPPRAPEVVYAGSLLHEALGGTVFFRHLEELPARVQARLATLLRDREFTERVRGEALPYTARPIAAADPNYQSHVDEGRVRLDLHRRFAEFRIEIPPLRERREDIPGLAQLFVAHACRKRETAEKALDSGAVALLSAMPWHGNSRELRDLLDNLVQATPDGTITLQALLNHVSLEGRNRPSPGLCASLREARQHFEREYISAVVAQHHGRIPDAAKSLGIQRTNLYRKLRALRLARPEVVRGA